MADIISAIERDEGKGVDLGVADDVEAEGDVEEAAEDDAEDSRLICAFFLGSGPRAVGGVADTSHVRS